MAAQRPSSAAAVARVALALGAALALADASIVTLALPELLDRLHTTVQGLAAVIGVYTIVLAVAVLAAVPLRRRLGSAAVGAGGLLLFAAASVACGTADGLTGLLIARGVQAVGAGAGLVAAFELLSRRRADAGRPAGLWVAAAIFGTAIGPALGGALTEAFDWRAIFLAQAPFGVLAALACLVPQGSAAAADDAVPGAAGSGAAAGASVAAGSAPARPTLDAHDRPAWPVPAPRPPASSARPAPHDAPTRVVGPDGEETLVDPAGAPGPGRGRPAVPARSGPDAPTAPQPIGVTAAGEAAAVGAAHGPSRPARASRPRMSADGARAGVALALVSAALTAVVFLLVLLLVTGWAVEPLKAAVGVTLLPVAALVGWRIPGDPWVRASAGCGMVGAGILALAALPTVGAGWVVLPQLLAGVGMGLALPALAGGLLPERDPGQAARLLSLRHVGITVALLVLAPVTAAQLDRTIDHTTEQVAALVLDARLPPQQKLKAITTGLDDVSTEDPRGSLRSSLDSQASLFASNADDAAVYARLKTRADETLVTAINGAFRPAFLITGGLALLAALIVLPPLGRNPALVLALCAAALGLAGGQVLVARSARPSPVVIADPCQDRQLPSTGGIDGFVQDAALGLLDRAACRFGSSREELALAIGSPSRARTYEREHGTDPRSVSGLVGGALGGGQGGPTRLEQLFRDLVGGSGS